LPGAAEPSQLVRDAAPLRALQLASGLTVGECSQHALAGAGGVEDRSYVLIEADRLFDEGHGVRTALRGASFF